MSDFRRFGPDSLSDAAQHWQDHGWALIEGMLEPSVVEQALDELQALNPREVNVASPSRSDHSTSPDDGPAFRDAQFASARLFPLPGAHALNRIFFDDRLTRFARTCLGTDDIRLYQARVTSKFGDRTNYEQPMHQDLNHSLVPTRSEPGYWHLETFTYLVDVDERTGAIFAVPRPGNPDIDPVSGRIAPPELAAHLYEEEIRVTASAGATFAYRSDLWHRASDLAPDAERHALVAGYRPAGVEWINYDPIAPLSINEAFIEFTETCSPEDLALLGVPRPGHDYWTSTQVDKMQVMYPGLNLDPWRGALTTAW